MSAAIVQIAPFLGGNQSRSARKFRSGGRTYDRRNDYVGSGRADRSLAPFRWGVASSTGRSKPLASLLVATVII
jgi:hypothetical protein